MYLWTHHQNITNVYTIHEIQKKIKQFINIILHYTIYDIEKYSNSHKMTREKAKKNLKQLHSIQMIRFYLYTQFSWSIYSWFMLHRSKCIEYLSSSVSFKKK